jgi:hypothetical protein
MIDITSRPEYNPLGTVRGSIGGGSWVLTGVFLPTPAPNMWVSVLTGEHVTHLMISLSGMPVIGAVPGTPAWELWKNYRMDREPQCTEWLDFYDAGSRCLYPDHHPGPHSFQETAQCSSARLLPHFTRCVFDRDHEGMHSYEARDENPDAIRLCAIPRGTSYCRRLRGHDGPCAYPPNTEEQS